MAIHIASGAMFTPFATSQYPLTVLLNGKDRSAHEPQLSAMLAKGVQLVETAVARLEPLSSDRGIRIHFVDVARDPLELDYLVYGAPTQQRSTELVASLGLSLDGMGNIVTSGLFQAASTKGVFAAGDAAVMAKAVPSATATGMAAGVGVAHELMLEDYGMAMPAFPSAPSPVEKKEAINAAASSGHPAASE
jgi:thioredoxin reductase